MNFPLSLADISLWLAVTAIILLITSELLHSSAEHSARINAETKYLRIAALVVGLCFLSTVVMRLFQPF